MNNSDKNPWPELLKKITTNRKLVDSKSKGGHITISST
jgi:hypothetical protein